MSRHRKYPLHARSRLTRTGIHALTLAGLTLIGGAAQAAASDDLAAHRALWLEQRHESYRYGYRKFCECNRDEPPETVVTVESGTIVRVHHVHAGSAREVPAREGSLDLYWTIEGLFGLIESALAGEALVRVRYDGAQGHPVSLFIDYDASFVGDELDLRLTRVEHLAGD